MVGSNFIYYPPSARIMHRGNHITITGRCYKAQAACLLGYKLSLSSAELLALTESVSAMYSLRRPLGGVPMGETTYIKATEDLKRLASLDSQDIARFLNADIKLGESLLSKLLNWTLKLDNPTPLIEQLVKLSLTSLSKLNAAIGLQKLKNALALWKKNLITLMKSFGNGVSQSILPY